MRAANTVQVQPLTNCLQRRSLSWIGQFVSGIALTSLSFSLLAIDEAEAISITFEKIVDTNTPVPVGIGNFGYFLKPSIDNGNVAFSGSGFESSPSGIYTNIGGKLNVVADTNTPIPGGTDTFDSFSSLSLDNESVAFLGTNSDQSGGSEQEGIYTKIGNTLSTVVDTKTPLPGGINTFDIFYGYSLDNGEVAFTIADVDSFQIFPRGIYTNTGGKLNIVADRNTPIPNGTNNFESFSPPSLDNGNVAFRGFNFTQGGVYTSIGGELNVIADTSTSIPGGKGTYDYFGEPLLDESDVAFGGTDFDQEGYIEQDGIYTNISGELNVVADTNTPIPGGTGTFNGFLVYDDFSLDGGNVAFFGSTDSEQQGIFEPVGIYTNIGGVLAEVIAIGDRLDGKEVESLNFGSEGLSGKQIAFTAYFTDTSEGIYIATVPEPASVLGTLAFGAFGASWMLKRKLKRQ